MSTLKPIKLYGSIGGPNPWKVAILLHELGIPHETQALDMAKDLKTKPYTDLNPNGRVPTIQDPNTGITLWESGAIIEYLIATYDTDHVLSYPAGSKEDWLCKQWLMFQASGQGPYFGQGVWFTNYHPDPVARDRYKKESERVTMVLDNALTANGTGYLVGNKATYADLAFIPWTQCLPFMWKLDGEPEEMKKMLAKYEAYEAWIASLTARTSVKEIEGRRGQAMKGGH